MFLFSDCYRCLTVVISRIRHQELAALNNRWLNYMVTFTAKELHTSL